MDYKGYSIMALGTFPMVEIKAKGQGRVPDELLGLFTTNSFARHAVDMYLESLKKGKKNGEAKDSSSG